LSVHGVNDVRQKEIHTAEPLAPQPSAFEVQNAFGKLKGHKSPRIDQIPEEFITAGVGQFVLRSKTLVILFGIKTNCLRSGRIPSFYLFTTIEVKTTLVIVEAYHFRQFSTNFYPTSCC
jgi:hypothetical protein